MTLATVKAALAEVEGRKFPLFDRRNVEVWASDILALIAVAEAAQVFHADTQILGEMCHNNRSARKLAKALAKLTTHKAG